MPKAASAGRLARVAHRRTLGEAAFPDAREFTELLPRLQESASTVLLRMVWRAYDALAREILAEVDVSRADEALETQITQFLEPRIDECLKSERPSLPWYVQHKPCEAETRAPAPAHHPEYDIAFRLNECPRVMWPLEAKVLRTDGRVGEYVREVTGNFLTCRYAPFSKEAAMLGYLLAGSPDAALSAIRGGLRCPLLCHPGFPDRPHRFSDHIRTVPDGKAYPAQFRCHHLILALTCCPPPE